MLETDIMQNPETVMFPGSETGNIGYPTQWALNPTAYQNMDASQVDWATLAQQWIQMKEAAAIVSAEAPPPPPAKVDEEAGEAPMEVENNDADGPQNWNSSESWGNNDWNQWGWDWTGQAGLDSKVPMDPAMVIQPVMDGFAVPSDSTPATGYVTGTATSTGPTFQHGYWTAPQVEHSSRSTTLDRKKREPKSNRGPRSHRDKVPGPVAPVVNPMDMASAFHGQALDAAKRRQLPAWIREGLEKMEREKQRAIEREQEMVAREEAEKEKKRREEEELARLKAEASGLPLIPPKSKFESDSEPEPEEDEESSALSRQKSSSPVRREPSPPPQPLVQKSKEEIMQEVMFVVRRSLTEILLEVTDQEIHSLSQEELARFNAAQASRLNAMKASKSKALAAITSGLGLGAYESSSEGSDDETDNNELSDQQLQEIIKRKRLAFEATSREIEAEVRRVERRELGEESDNDLPARDREHTPVVSKRESSGTPPPVLSETPEKINDRRVSKDTKQTKPNDRPVPSKKLEPVSESKSKKKHDSPPKHNNKERSSSSSDSEADSSTTSESSDSDKRNTKSSRSKKRKHKSSSDSDSKRSKRHRKEKSYKHEEKDNHKTKYDYKDKSRSKKRDRDDERSYKSRDDRSHRDKYREDSDDDKYSRRRRSRSGSYTSRSGRRRSRDRSSDRSYDRRSDRYERSRHRRSRTPSRHRR